jgi:hypothetical protein
MAGHISETQVPPTLGVILGENPAHLSKIKDAIPVPFDPPDGVKHVKHMSFSQGALPAPKPRRGA